MAHLDKEFINLPDVTRTTARSRHLEAVLSNNVEPDFSPVTDETDGVQDEGPSPSMKDTDDMPVLGSRVLGNRISLETDTGSKIRRPTGVGEDAFAVRVDVSSVGHRVQPGTILVAEGGHEIVDGDLVIIRDGFDNSALVAVAVAEAGSVFLEMQNPKSSVCSTELTEDESVFKVRAILLPA